MNVINYLREKQKKLLAENRSNSKFKILSCLLDGVSNPRFFVTFDDKKIAYLVISKNACTTIKAALADNIVLGIGVHYSDKFENTFNKLPENKLNYFKFTFVRNPFERLVSCYVNKFEQYEKWDKFFIFKHYLRGFLKENDSFEQFANKVSKIPDIAADMHFKSQYSFIYDKKDNVLVDYIGKVESLEQDFKKIKKQYNLGKLIVQNKTDKKDWRKYYNKNLAEKIYKRYKKDFDLWYPDEYKKLLTFLDKGNE